MNASRVTPELLHLFVNLQALLGMTMFAIFHLFVDLLRFTGDDTVFLTVPRDVVTLRDKTWEEPRLREVRRGRRSACY